MGIHAISEKMDQDRLQHVSNRLLQTDHGFITNWSIEPIGPVNGNFVTGGVFLVAGTTDVGKGISRSWKLVLKIVIADLKRNDPGHYNYWRREVLAYESGELQRLPAQLIVPECYAIEEKEDGSVWLWLEHITQQPNTWECDDYAYAAEKLGEFHAAYLLGEPLPDFPWVNRQWMHSWVNECRKFQYVPSNDTKDLILSHQRAAAITERFLLAEGWIPGWLSALDRLPRTFAHQDYYEFNIMLNSDDLRERKLVVIDWQFASISGIGEDLGRFYGLTVSRGQVPQDQFAEYRELFLGSYIRGMRRAGWHGDETLPRFGFLAAFALRSVWEVPKLLQKLGEDAESTESLRLMHITELQMDAAVEAERLRLSIV